MQRAIGPMNFLANLSDLSASFPNTVITVRRSFLEKNRETVKRFVRAYSEDHLPIQSRQGKNNGGLCQTPQTTGPAKIVEATHQYYAPRFSYPPRFDRGGASAMLLN